MKSHTLHVPGATLYYEVRGKGPVLLMIPGAGGDAAAADGMAEILQSRFTVVTFDPRGYSRSTLDSGVAEDQYVAVQREDAFRLLAHLTDEPAYVFGGSNGATVGLDLITAHPDRVCALVAHEPACFAVLPDAAEQRAVVEEVRRLLRTEGIAAAARRFGRALGDTVKPGPEHGRISPREAARRERSAANAPIMIEHELIEFTSYTPDYTALSRVADRLTLAAGRDSRGYLPYRPVTEIAARLGLPVTEFPGAHNGGFSHPEQFAAQLLDVLAASPIPDRA